jgi:hypothetical protein
MRTLAIASSLVLTGCLFSSPDGATQSWPPPLGGTVEAVVAGNLDTDGATDIVVFMSGSDSVAGAYALEGGASPTSFSTFVPLPIVHPAAAFLEPTAAPTIYLTTGADTLAIYSFANTLRELATGTTTVPGGTSAAIGLMDFPGAMSHVWVTNGAAIDHTPTTLDDVKPVPPPGSSTWTNAQLATSYADEATQSQIAVVATSDNVYRCPIPTMMAPFEFEAVRTSGTMWQGQTLYDFNGDGRDEVVGFDVQAHQLCIVDPGAATIPVAAACVASTMTTYPGNEVQIFAGVNLSMNDTPDVLVVQADDTATHYTIFEDVTFDGTMASSSKISTPPPAGPAHGKTVVTSVMTGSAMSVVTFGSDGAAACELGPC